MSAWGGWGRAGGCWASLLSCRSKHAESKQTNLADFFLRTHWRGRLRFLLAFPSLVLEKRQFASWRCVRIATVSRVLTTIAQHQFGKPRKTSTAGSVPSELQGVSACMQQTSVPSIFSQGQAGLGALSGSMTQCQHKQKKDMEVVRYQITKFVLSRQQCRTKAFGKHSNPSQGVFVPPCPVAIENRHGTELTS